MNDEVKGIIVGVVLIVGLMIILPLVVLNQPLKISGTVVGKYPEIGGFGSAHPNQLLIKDHSGKEMRVDVLGDKYFRYNINDSINWTGTLGETESWSFFNLIPIIGVLLAVMTIVPFMIRRIF